MAVSVGRFSWCLWGQGKDKDVISNGSSSSSSSVELGFGLIREPDKKKKNTNKNTNKNNRKIASTNWQSRTMMRIDSEFDFVVVSDGSDASDISIGWMEPLGPAFRTRDDDELDSGFAVLVPCYSPGCKELAEGSISSAFEFSPDCKKYMEQVLPLRALMPKMS